MSYKRFMTLISLSFALFFSISSIGYSKYSEFSTLPNSELYQLVGGSENSRQCSVIPDCETIGPDFCSLITGSANAQRCSQTTESVPVASVDNRDCLQSAPPTTYCDASPETNWCNIEYACT